ncbi:hypothetical protein ACXR2T_03765 [Leucobacter sp. HY1910]
MLMRRLASLALMIGPLLFALSPFFWVGKHYGVVGGFLVAISTVPWLFGLISEYDALRAKLPVWSGLWMLLTLIGAFGTVAFGIQGVFESLLGFGEWRGAATFDTYPLPVTLILMTAGPAFPLALFILGAMYWKTGLVPRWAAALLMFAAIAFPIARVTRDFPFVFIADFTMLAAFCAIAWYASRRPAPHLVD